MQGWRWKYAVAISFVVAGWVGDHEVSQRLIPPSHLAGGFSNFVDGAAPEAATTDLAVAMRLLLSVVAALTAHIAASP